MAKIKGTPAHPGAAIGIGVKFGPNGFPELSSRLIAEATRALRQNLPREEHPQIILVCNDLADAATLRFPGLVISGIAARDPLIAQFPLDVPAVADLGRDLFLSEDEELIIVDGTRGIAYLSPDARTVERYEQMLAREEEGPRYFIGSEHEPAKTMDGRTVSVAVVLNPEDDYASAIAEGADELLLLSSDGLDLPQVLAFCADKSISMLTRKPDPQILMPALWNSAPGQITLVIPADEYDCIRSDFDDAIEQLREQPPDYALEAALPRFGVYSDGFVPIPDDADFLVILPDLSQIDDLIATWNSEIAGETVTMVVQDDLAAAKEPIELGVRAVAVTQGLVSEAKNLIRSLPPDYIV